jgi:L-ascorbate metabolism protein UlaG (beta-lactamase superfamily)
MFLLFACNAAEKDAESGRAAVSDSAGPESGGAGGDSSAESGGDTVGADTAPPAPDTLEVRFLSVGGFHLRAGDDALITAPLYTNPDLWETLTEPVVSDAGVISRYLGDVSDAKAVLVGHAHYDHLLDVPFVRNQTDDATIYGNESVYNIMSAFAPERDPSCTDTAEEQPEQMWVPPDRLVNVDDFVDYRNCGEVDPCVPYSPAQEGQWITVEGTKMRIKAICSSHPDQFWIIHFGQGCIDDPQCTPPPTAADWLEGTTLAWMIDFLGRDGSPIFRIYYQDAPTEVPVGLPSSEDLLEKGVDLALLNAGNYDAMVDHPGGTIRYLQPRYVIMGHWEDFFRTLDEPVQPLPFMDLDDLRLRLETEMPGEEGVRWWIPDPATEFAFGRE